MSNFVDDDTDLDFPKSTSRVTAPGFEDKTLRASDWNTICQACEDLRSTLRSSTYGSSVPASLAHLRVEKTFYTVGELSPAQITSNQNNYHPSGLENTTVLFLTSDAARDITGISYIATAVGVPAHPLLAFPITGRHLWVHNGGNFIITLKHLNAGSQAENRFVCWGSSDIKLSPGSCVQLYHSTLAGTVWVQISGPRNALTTIGAAASSAQAAPAGTILELTNNADNLITFRGADANVKGINFANTSSAVDGSVLYDGIARGLQFRTGGNNTRMTIASDGTVSMLDAVVESDEIAPSQITSNQNDYAPTGWASCVCAFLTSDAARDITGFGNGVSGRRVWVYNGGSFNITLKHLNAGSAASNRIIGRSNADTVLTPGTGTLLRYSALAGSVWVVMTDSL